jgi:beta-glucosidase
MTNISSYLFPEHFAWGVAAAAPQVEGAATEGGKGESIWDRFAAQPDKTAGGDTPTVACDHYHLYAEDFALMKSLGVRNYRLSVAWPRIYPTGTGAVNEKGLEFYDRLIDSMLTNDITPWVTLYHWDLPQVLEEQGGWRTAATSQAFGDFAATVVKRLGDRVKNWMTLNELLTFIFKGYSSGRHAPGARESQQVVNQCYHHALMAHGYAVQAVREHGGAGARVGLVHNPIIPVPVTEMPADIAAARASFAEGTAQILAPIYTGAYPESWLLHVEADAPIVAPGELELIASPTDFLGLNVYGGDFVRAGGDGQPERLPLPTGYPKANLDWLSIVPQAAYWAVRHAAEHYGVKDVYITENGLSQEDQLNEHGEVLDLGRREFYRNYLSTLQRATAEGLPARGFFAWSFMDNYEWAEGYRKRFGLVYVDYATQKRTPKLSAQWYASVIEQNRVL